MPPQPSPSQPSPPSSPASDARPRVAIDLRALVPQPTGIGVVTRSLALELAARGSFRLLGLAHRPPRGSEELAAAGIEIEHQPAPLGVIWQQLVLPRRLRRGDVDLLWSPLASLPISCPVPAVTTVHDLTVLLMPEAHTAKVRWSLLPFLRASLDKARRIVAVSRATADDIAFHYPGVADKVRVVYNGVDPEFRPGNADEIAATRRHLGMPHGYILYAGTLEPRKNVGALLDAWESLEAEADGGHGGAGSSGGAAGIGRVGDAGGADPGPPPAVPPLVLAGPYGWGSRDLARRIERLTSKEDVALGVRSRPAAAGALLGFPSPHQTGAAAGAASAGAPPRRDERGEDGAELTRWRRRFLALGHVERSDLVRVFQAASLFVYPSLYEGFGLPAAEALACGVPVVALAASSLPEVVGDAGLLVEPGDSGALAAAMARIVANPGLAADLAGRAIEQAARFRWDRAAAEMIEVFQEALR